MLCSQQKKSTFWTTSGCKCHKKLWLNTLGSGMKCFGSSTLKERNDPCASLDQTRGECFTTKIAMNGERKVAPIAHPMIMGFDGITHFIHLRLMKFQCNLQLNGLMNHASHLTIKKVVKNVVKSGWRSIAMDIPLGDICSAGYSRPCKKASSMSMSFSRVFSVVSSSPASLAFSSSSCGGMLW